AALGRAGQFLGDAGYVVEPAEPPDIGRIATAWRHLVTAEMRHLSRETMLRDGDDGIRAVVRQLDELAPSVGMVEYMAGLAERNRWRRAWALFHERYPLALMPVSLEPPFAIGFDTSGRVRMDEVLAAQAPQYIVNFLGLPAAAVPTGLAHGLPMGVQIVGASFREDLCLDAAEAIEARVGLTTPIDPKI
ncbi:MAG: amidase, partial [Alphaproteobacteria bacterium]|nr:amidase [Alphaproteobacteria bacterium]